MNTGIAGEGGSKASVILVRDELPRVCMVAEPPIARAAPLLGFKGL